MRCIGIVDAPWIVAAILIGLYLLFISHNRYGLVILAALVVVVIVWLALWKRACRLPAPPPDKKQAPPES
jgi:hypothetical protein